MRIGEVAAASGVSVRALRYYEEERLLHSVRTDGGQRRYDEGAVERVAWIQRLFAAGLSSATLRDLLPCVHSGVVTDDDHARLRAELDRLDARVADLFATRARLHALVTQAEELRARSGADVPG